MMTVKMVIVRMMVTRVEMVVTMVVWKKVMK